MATAKQFDPELIYVECTECGQPVLWEPGKTTEILEWSGVDPFSLDSGCMILSEGCPLCKPDNEAYVTHIVRVRDEGWVEPVDASPSAPS